MFKNPSVNFTNLKIGTINCRGLNDHAKRTAIFEVLKNSKLSIIFLQETKLNPFKHSKIEHEWHNKNILLNSIPGGKSGTAILFNSPNIQCFNKLTDYDGRIIATDVEIFGNVFHLVNTYFPTENALKKNFIHKLYPFVYSKFPVIWGGDHNIVTNPMIDRIPARSTLDFLSN